jgi:hypothetical protein
MASISIRDLPRSATLDRKAMSAVRGAGAPWVFGWIRPFVEAGPSQVPVINFYQINNFADQMINQFQTVSVNNAGANSTLNVVVDANSLNNALL